MADKEISLILKAKDAASGAIGRVNHSLGGLHDAAHRAGGKIVELGKHLAEVGFGIAVAGFALLEETIRRSTGTADAYGVAVARVAAITKESVPEASRLVAVFQRFGLEGSAAIRTIGMLERNVGGFTESLKKEKKFTSEFGFALRDANGHIKNASTLILQAADYFNNKHIPASQRALLEAKLFGRQWQSLVPILKLGKKGIKDAGDEAQKLGLILSRENAGDLAKFHKAGINLKESWGGFQLQLGLLVMPTLNKLFSFISTTAIPALRNIVAAVQSWFSQNQPLIAQVQDFVQRGLRTLGDFLTLIGPRVIAFGKVLADAAVVIAKDVVPRVMGFVDTLVRPGGVIDSIGKVVGPILSKLIPAFGKVVDALFGKGGLIPSLGDLAGTLWDGGNSPLAQAVKFIGEKFSDLVGFLADVVRAAAKFVQWVIKHINDLGILKTIANGIATAFGLARDAVGFLIDKLNALLDWTTKNLNVLKGLSDTLYNLLHAPFGVPDIPHRALGGPVRSGVYRVGESGPETLVMRTGGGYIIPNGGPGPAMAMAGDGGQPVVIILQLDGREIARVVDEHLQYEYNRAPRTAGRP